MRKQNIVKGPVLADRRGRTFWTDALRTGRMYDATSPGNKPINICLQHFPEMGATLDDSYLGLSRDHDGKARRSGKKAATRSTAWPERAVGT